MVGFVGESGSKIKEVEETTVPCVSSYLFPIRTAEPIASKGALKNL
jgi:hypothetical protein